MSQKKINNLLRKNFSLRYISNREKPVIEKSKYFVRLIERQPANDIVKEIYLWLLITT
jgi:hypothetical protein